MAPAAAGRHREHLSRQAQHHISPADARRGETRRQRCSPMMRIERTSAGMATRAGSGSVGCSSIAAHGNAALAQQVSIKAGGRRSTILFGAGRMHHLYKLCLWARAHEPTPPYGHGTMPGVLGGSDGARCEWTDGRRARGRAVRIPRRGKRVKVGDIVEKNDEVRHSL